MLLLLALHAVIGGLALVAGRRLGKGVYALGTVPMLATLAFVATEWGEVTGGGAVHHRATWIPELGIVADARLDGFALVMVLLVSGMGVAVLAYSASYFSPGPEGTRTAGLLVLFAGSMLGLVLADNLAWLYVSWELTSITSFLLIGGNQLKAEQRSAALRALLVTGSGGLAMLGGLVILAQSAGTWSLHEILADPPDGRLVGVALGLILCGALTKSAQYPFHFWLPGAMVAPTPISAYLHSATMVKAGIYLVARLGPAFAATGIWRPAIVAVGLTTMVAGGLRALRQHDLKLLLAFGTVSQLGFLLVLAGVGHPAATKAATVLLLAHGLFKGALFLVVGMVDHGTGTRDLREIPALGTGWSTVRVVALVSAASMAGLPPLVGFVAKESAYEAFVHGSTWDSLTLAGLVAGSILTFAYSMRFARPFLSTAVSEPRPSTDEGAAHPVHAPSRALLAPTVALAGATVVAGLAAGAVLDDLVRAGANALDPEVGAAKIALWHGVNLALGLSALTIALGLVLVGVRHQLERLQARWTSSWTGDRVFAAMVHGLNVTARRTAGVVQPGSLPIYVGVILVVVVGVPTGYVLTTAEWPGWPRVQEVPAQGLLAVALAVAAAAVAVVRRRFASVLLLGSVGYLMAVVFAVQGAADLALTQFAIETLSVVVFVLVVRHLPERFRPSRGRLKTTLRLAVAGVIGLSVFVLAMMTTAGTGDRAVSEEIVRRSEPDGGGKNVVNVVLVDVRALDTLGEVTVLVVAAVGVVALARVGRRPTAGTGPNGDAETAESDPDPEGAEVVH